jgi:hypothetical protein
VTTPWTDDHASTTVTLGDDIGMWYADERYGVREHHVRLLQERAITPESPRLAATGRLRGRNMRSSTATSRNHPWVPTGAGPADPGLVR